MHQFSTGDAVGPLTSLRVRWGPTVLQATQTRRSAPQGLMGLALVWRQMRALARVLLGTFVLRVLLLEQQTFGESYYSLIK